MPNGFEDIVKLTAVQTELTEVIRQLSMHREVPGGDVTKAIEHLKSAVAEVDRTIAEAES